MSSLALESSSPETMTSQASEVNSSCQEFVEDPEIETLQEAPFKAEKNPAMQPLTGGENVVRIYSKAPNYLPLACLAMLVNPILGIPAAVCSLVSRSKARRGKWRISAKLSKVALWLSIFSIASCIIVVVLVIFYVFVVTPNIIRNIDGLTGGAMEETTTPWTTLPVRSMTSSTTLSFTR